jgi:outer membrane protein OmpA-like peptidoglycan-associated protein
MSHFIHRRALAWLTIPLLSLAACATAMPPQELVEARAAYQRAETGPAATLVPAELHVAAESLATAEKSFNDSPKSRDTVDDAYIALRKIQRAEALGRTAEAVAAREQALREAGKTREEILADREARLRETRGELRDTKGALHETKGQLEQARDSVAVAQAETAAEHTARLDAEKRAQDSMDALAKSMALKKDTRGTVITLSGGVLFKTGEANLLPGAQVQLNQVADALKTQAEHHFVIGGHTDTQGTDSINDELSARRANAVREYLVVRGVAADAISAQGFGSHQPISDNKTTEGRAMNRRVEIIVVDNNTQATR